MKKLILKDDNGKKLPKEVQDRVNEFLQRVENVKWFQPLDTLTKEEVDKQINFTLKCFGVKASIEYKSLKTEKAWASAFASAVDATWTSAVDSARDSTVDSARASARTLALDSTWTSARTSARTLASSWTSVLDSARASAEILVLDKISYKYPNGAFIQLFKLWEMGLYPCGVINGKFIIYSTKDLI